MKKHKFASGGQAEAMAQMQRDKAIALGAAAPGLHPGQEPPSMSPAQAQAMIGPATSATTPTSLGAPFMFGGKLRTRPLLRQQPPGESPVKPGGPSMGSGRGLSTSGGGVAKANAGGYKEGGSIKGYAKGGAVRGSGCEQRGTKQCKVY